MVAGLRLHFDSQLIPGGPAIRDGQPSARSALASSWNVDLDTVVLLGSVANSHGDPGRWWFATGASLGSLGWFSALGAGARLLTPLMHQVTWRVLDALIAVTMLSLGISLLLH